MLRTRLSHLRLFVILHFAFCILLFGFCFLLCLFGSRVAHSVRVFGFRPFPRNFCRFAFFSDLGVYRRPRIPSFLLPGSRFHSRVATGLAPYEALLSRQERECRPRRQKPRNPVFCIHYFGFRNDWGRIFLRIDSRLPSPQCCPLSHSLLNSTSAPSSSSMA